MKKTKDLKLNIYQAIRNKYSQTQNIDPLILRFRELIRSENNIQKPLEYYADVLKVSQTKLYLVTKAELKITPREFVREILITEILENLVSTEIRLKELCYGFGFPAPASLTKFIKTATGYSPSKYRALNCIKDK
ncbi:MAG: helix-turn-helix domain-containing protein [Sphingobacterium sp.]|jgi:AraC-like DNA-binding protein|nr:helix-turn-helix domain-containing protein [Sphingobacterium sp.]